VHAAISAASADGQTVLMPQLLQTLCDALKRSFGSVGGVSVQLASDAISLPVDDAIAIALFANEAVTNAFKHAFADQAPGAITVQLQGTPEHTLVLKIADSGVGTDLSRSAGGMGRKLMHTLAAQLRGTLEIEGRAGAGTRVTLTMNRQSAAQSAPRLWNPSSQAQLSPE
jgi:two-component sensor histidine kinase